MLRETEEIKSAGGGHSIVITEKQRVVISGVEDVDSFDENNVVMLTTLGMLSLTGADLHMSRLSLEEGQMVIEGDIIGLAYSDVDTRRQGNWLGRLFR
jgi:sporulation protein YabP